MTPGRARLPRVAATLATALTLLACSPSAAGEGEGGGAQSGRNGAAGPGTATATAAGVGPCPRLAPAEPRAGGLADLRLPCLGAGPAVRLSDLRGVPTVLNVWAAWCPNCADEMPLFAAAMRRAGGDLRFLGVHYKATREQGLQAQADFGAPFPSVHDEDGDLVVARLGAYAPPQTFFVTADGRVAGRKIGEISSQQELTRLVRRYLGVDL